MDQISTEDGVKYGLSIFAYIIVVGIAGFALFAIGAVMVDSSPLTGLVTMFAGFVIGMAGMAGLQYKIIADSVAAGLAIHDQAGEESTS